MKRWSILSLFVLVGIFVICASIPGTKMQGDTYSPVIKKPDVKSSGYIKRDPGFGNIPLYFIPNHGQVDEKVRFYAKTPAYTLWMTKEGLMFDSVKKVEVKAEVEEGHPSQEKHTPPFGHPSQEGNKKIPSSTYSTHSTKIERDVSRLIFPGANKNHEMVPVELCQHQVNYLKGKDPSKWQTGIRTSKAVLYEDIYKNIDFKVYGNEKQVEYDWIVKPGADPKVISFKYEQVSNTRIDREGNLVVEAKSGKLMHKKPAGYQVIDGKRVPVKSAFKKVGDNTYGFEVKKYNRDFELIIDPMVCPIYSTYLGGSGEDKGYGITIDSEGYSYVTGYTVSTNFPTKNPYQGIKKDSIDAFVTKLSPTDGCPVYSTYFGGSGYDYGYGIAVDSNKSAYVTGLTKSPDFPTKNPYQGTINGDYVDVFVTKLSPAGNTLEYSTYLGGSRDEFGWGIAVDINGSAYVTGSTGSTNFPTKNPYQGIKKDSIDAFVTKLSPGGNTLEYSTYLGGSRSDSGSGIAVDSNGNAYVTGHTESTNFPTKNPYQGIKKDSIDAFVTKLSPGGSTLCYSTYLGGNGNDYGYGIAVDINGSAYVTGGTRSTDFPTKNPYQETLNGRGDVFVTKLSPGGNTLFYSTYLGENGNDYGCGIAIDNNGSAYVTGDTNSTDFPTKNPYQGTLNGWGDAFVTKLSPGGSTLFYSTYLGGNNLDYGRGIAVDSYGSVYVTGFTSSENFPTHNACQNSLAGSRNAFVARLCYSDTVPVLAVNKTQLNFAVNSSGITTGDQGFLIRNLGGGAMNWTVSDDADWLECYPENGTNFGVVTVSVNTSGLSPKTYTGTITTTDTNAINSPITIAVTLIVYNKGGGKPVQPFGFFETPGDGAEVQSSMPVTGWALDDIEVVSVKLYREAGPNLIYIGDALFVEGARPDVALAYPQYPNCSRAGWGYMMLTNALLDGTYVLHAIAADKEGNNVTLGTKTITIINATAVKPFGAIDKPIPGGTASGSNYRAIGWALTPPPNKIPSNGIHLFIDGVDLGEATYDIFRQDVYDLFPGYENRNGALAYYDFNTTGYDNGMHTIQFAAKDNAGNTDGIGSRYFNIYNLGSINSLSHASYQEQYQYSKAQITEIAVDYTGPIKMRKGNKTDIKPEILYPGESGNIDVEIKEVERIEIHLSDRKANFTYTGYLEVGEQLWQLPIGSTLDTQRGIFYWSPGSGIIGLYRLVFIGKGPDREMNKKFINVNIVAKFKK
jgi:hypothetical protein